MKLRSIGNQLDKEAQVSSRGATVTGFNCDDIDIIYPQKMVKTKLKGGIPICFPIFGPPKEKFATEIPQHGLLRNEELKLIAKSPYTLAFKGIIQGKKTYPWSLQYEVWISMRLDTLSVKLLVTRLKDGIAGDAPVNAAFHPYFSNLGRRAVRIGDEEMIDFPEKARIVPLRNDRSVIIDLGRKKVKMSLGGDFGEQTHIVLWSDNDAYFCVEPVLTHPDDFDTPKGKYLREGESLTLVCSIEVLE